MTPEDLGQVEALYEAALAGADVTAAVARLPEALRAQFEELLRARHAVLFGLGGAEGPVDARAVRDGGARIGPFQLVRLLGRGGQGAVWLAMDTRIRRPVALKLLDTPLGATPERQERFRREAEVAARLAHPSICAVYEMGQSGGVAYLAMQYHEGQTLAQWLERLRAGEPAPHDWLRVAEDTARALHAAHAAGIVHRDLKPHNLLVTPEGQPVILDFGLAEDTRPDALTLTQQGAVLGTPAYLPPERLSATFGTPDHRSDVWSLAATFYELLTGRPPFHASTREGLYRAILEHEPEDLAALRPDLPREAAVVFAVALEKDLARRHATALAFAEDLGRARQRQPILARPTPWPARTLRWVDRHRLPAALVGAVFAAVTIGLVVALVLLAHARDALHQARRSLRLAEAQVMAERDPGEALQIWLQNAELAPVAVVNNALVKLLERSHEHGDLAGHDGAVSAVEFSPDGSQLVTACADGRVRVFDVGTRQVTHTLRCDAPAGAAVFDPTGTRVACGDERGTVRIVTLTVAVPDLQAEAGSAVRSLCWLGDGAVVFGTEAGRVAILEPGRGLEVHELGQLGAPVTRVAVVGGQGRVLASAADGCVHAWQLDETRSPSHVLPPLRHRSGEVHDLAVSPDGRWVVTASSDNVAYVWDLLRGRVVQRFTRHGTAVLGAAFHPRGELVATCAGDRGIELWDPRTGEPRLQLRLSRRSARRLAFSPDGQLLVSGSEDGVVRLWRVGPRSGVATLAHDQPMVSLAAFSTSGAQVVTLAASEAAWLWDARTGARQHTLRCHDGQVQDACFVADDRLVATAAGDRTVCLSETLTGALVRRVVLPAVAGTAADGAPDQLSLVASPDRTRLLVLSRRGAAVLLEVATGSVRCELRGCPRFYSTGTVPRAAFRPDQALVATVVRDSEGENQIVLWRIDTGVQTATVRVAGGFVESLAFSPDGRCLAAAGSDGRASVFQVGDDGSLAFDRALGASGSCLIEASFDAGGTRVLTAGQDGNARVFDLATGQCLQVLGPHYGMLYGARFSPDGRRVVTASWDRAAAVFSAETGELLLRYESHSGPVFCAQWSPDGRGILSAGYDGTARLWPSDPLGFARGQ